MTGNRPIPAGFRVLADAAGEDAAITICLAYGGTRLYVPYSAVGTKLEDLIGLEAARKIVDVAAGNALEIPLSARVLSNALAQRGWSQERRARVLCRARRTIQRWDNDTVPSFPLVDLID